MLYSGADVVDGKLSPKTSVHSKADDRMHTCYYSR